MVLNMALMVNPWGTALDMPKKSSRNLLILLLQARPEGVERGRDFLVYGFYCMLRYRGSRILHKSNVPS